MRSPCCAARSARLDWADRTVLAALIRLLPGRLRGTGGHPGTVLRGTVADHLCGSMIATAGSGSESSEGNIFIF